MKRAPDSMLNAAVVFITIVVLGESLALLLDYSNNAFLQQYVSANAGSIAAQIGLLAIVALGSAFLVHRRSSLASVTVEAPKPISAPAAESMTTSGRSGSSLLSDTSHLFVRSLKKLLRNPILLFFSLFQPIIFILLFTQLFSRFAQIPGFFQLTGAQNYTDFAVAGIVLQNGFSSAFQSGTSMVDDLRSGFLVKMLATPVSRSAILLGRITTDMFRMVVQSAIIFFLAFLLGATPVTGIPGYLLMLLTIAFFGLAWSGISLSIGLKTRSAETVFGIAGTLTFPLLFMSTALSPRGFLPDWMKTVSDFNPISLTVEAIRAIMLNGYDAGKILTAYGVIGAIGIVTLGATLYLFKKVVS